MRAFNVPFLVCGAVMMTACAEVAGVGERDRLADDAAAPDAGPDAVVDAAPAEAAPLAEICNFASENYDGLTDHGFDWVVGEWQPGPSVTQAEALKAVALADGRVAVAVLDQASTRVQVFVVDAAGSQVSGPAELDSAAAFSGFGIAVAGADRDEIGVAVGSSDPGCSPDCVSLTRFGAADLAEVETRSLDPSKLGQTYTLHDVYDLAWSTAGYVALVVDEDGQPRIAMADHMGDKFGSPQWSGVFGVGGPEVGSLSVGPEIGWAMSGESGGMSKAAIGIASLGAYSEILPPQSPDLPSQSPQIARDGKALAWLGRDLVYARTGSSGGTSGGWLSRFDATGQLVSQALAGLGTEAHSVVVVDGSPVATYLDPAGIGIARFTPDLVRVDTPSGDILVGDTTLHAIVGYPGGITLVRVSPDGTRVEAAPLRCP